MTAQINTVNEYISAESVLADIKATKTRMVGLVWRCVRCIEISTGESYKEMKNCHPRYEVIIAKGALIWLLNKQTMLSVKETAQVLGIDPSHATKIRKRFEENQSSIFKAIRKDILETYVGMVRTEYDEQIPF